MAEKLAFCSVALNFAESPEEDRDRKTATLEELLDFIRQNFPTLSRALICDFVEMVTANIFRPLPNLQMTDGVDPLDEEEEWQDPSWPHLSLAYTILLTLLEHQHFEPNSLKTVVNKPFIEKLLGLFFSADAGERETLKTVLHRIYGNFISLRRIIRVRVSELLLSVIHEGNINCRNMQKVHKIQKRCRFAWSRPVAGSSLSGAARSEASLEGGARRDG